MLINVIKLMLSIDLAGYIAVYIFNVLQIAIDS